MSDVCPKCGYCKACGRGNGYWYQPYTYPYTVPNWSGITWSGSNIQGGISSRLGGINGGCSLENDKDKE